MATENRYEIKAVGHGKRLFAELGPATCGEVTDGVVFWFEGEGAWVIDLSELKRLAADAESARVSTSTPTGE